MRLTIFTLAILFSISTVSVAQLSKADKKEWKKKMKSAGLDGFKELSDERDAAVAKASSMEAELESLEVENTKLKSDVADYKKAAKEAAEKLAAEKLARDKEEEGNSYGLYSRSISKGVVYKVQLGAYKNFDMTKYFNNHKNFSGEIDDDGTMKYTVGEFTEYWEAEQFKKLLREMGVKGAWIVSYQEGKRIPLKDALEGVR